MNSRTTLLLLLVLAVLGGAAWFLRPTGEVDPWAKPTENLVDAKQPALLKGLGLDANRITKIAFAPAGKPGLTLVRAGDAWQLAEPFRLTLKQAQVEALLILPLTETQDLGAAEASAETAQGSVEITSADGKTMRLDLGENLGAGVGMLRQGDRAWRVSTHLHDLLSDLPPLVALVNPQLDLPPAGRLAALAVESGKSRLRVARGKTGFTLDLPGAPRANAEAVALYCEELRKLSIVEIPRETASDAVFGFDRSPVTVVLEESGGGKTKLEVGGPTGPDLKRHFIRLTPPSGAPLVAAVETAQVKGLPQGAEFFRDWRVSGMKAGDVRRLVIVRSCKPEILVDLTRDAQGRIAFTDPKAPYAVDPELAQVAFGALANLKPTGAGPVLRPLDPYLGLTLTDAFGRKEDFTLVDDGKTCAIQRAGDPSSFTVPKAQVEVLLGGAEKLRDRTLAGFGTDEITTLHLEQVDCDLTHDFVKKEGKWTTSDGSPFELAAVEELERALKAPRAEAFIRWEPRSSFLLSAASSAKKLSLNANVVGWGNFSGTDGKTQQLCLKADLLDLLQSEFRPRQLLALTPDQIAHIDITNLTDHPTRITREADGTFKTAGLYGYTAASLTPAHCAQLFDALGNLRAEKPHDLGSNNGVLFQIHDVNGKSYQLGFAGEYACFYHIDEKGRHVNGRWFACPPASPQTKALQAILDQINKPKQP